MLRLSKKADYALIAMKHLAQKRDGASSSAREIAASYDIPTELLAKVLQRLGRTGVLTAQQGTRGGYTLSRPSSGISGGGGVPAIDGPFSVTGWSAGKNGRGEQRKRRVPGPPPRNSATVSGAA